MADAPTPAPKPTPVVPLSGLPKGFAGGPEGRDGAKAFRWRKALGLSAAALGCALIVAIIAALMRHGWQSGQQADVIMLSLDAFSLVAPLVLIGAACVRELAQDVSSALGLRPRRRSPRAP